MWQNNNRFLCAFFLLALLGFVTWKLILPTEPREQKLEGLCFGTTYHITIISNKDDATLPKDITDKLQVINQQMSVFDPESEISRINQAQADKWIILSPAMQQVMRCALEVYTASQGSFDPTVGPLIELWGFGVNKANKSIIPNNEEIEQARANCGFHLIEWKPDFSALRKAKAELTFNLSAIAKGYGVDQIAQLLKDKGYKDFIVEIGGEVYASGSPKKGKAWMVGIERSGGQGIALQQQGLATSGNYNNVATVEGQTRAHTINPRDGQPIANGLSSISVISDTTMKADALATALMAMPREEVEAFLHQHQIAAILVD